MKTWSFLLDAIFIASLGTVFIISTTLLLFFLLIYLIIGVVAAVCLAPFALLYLWTVGKPKKNESLKDLILRIRKPAHEQ